MWCLEHLQFPFQLHVGFHPNIYIYILLQVEEGADSGEEEETLTRKFIKRQAQMIVEAKARKRNRPVSTFKS